MNRFLLFLLLLTLSARAAHAAELDPELTKKAVAVL
jgi:hypothetical protein